jgi:hypothetical protein
VGQSQLEEVGHGWDPHSDSGQLEREGVVLSGLGHSLMQYYYSPLKARFVDVMQRLSRIVQHVTNAMNAIGLHKQMDNFCLSYSRAVQSILGAHYSLKVSSK